MRYVAHFPALKSHDFSYDSRTREGLMIRFAHISDVHVTCRPLGWSRGDFFSKRAMSWLNQRFGRGRFFRKADDVLRRLTDDRRQRGLERVVFSGDASVFGLPREFDRAAELLGVDHGPGLAVPGNHDYAMPGSETSGEFERRFAAWQSGERIDGHQYPFAQKWGDVWFVALNSCKGNRWFWDATGRVGVEQADRLRQLLAKLSPEPRILVTHYPICLKSGRKEKRTHGLVDLAPVLEIANTGGVVLWLHGHRHGFYVLPRPGAARFPAICIGSSTQRGCWSYGDYAIEGGRLTGVRRVFDVHSSIFRDGERFSLELKI